MGIYSQETIDWFFTTFDASEITIIDELWVRQGMANLSSGKIEYPEPLSKSLGTARTDKNRYVNSRWRDYGELNCLAESLTMLLFKPHRELAERCVSCLIQRDLHPMFAHFYLTSVAEMYYSDHEIERTIDYCNMVLAFAISAAKEFKREYPKQSLPSHKAYERLCIIYDKKLNFDEAIRIAEQAKSEDWAGDWDRRIARYTARKTGTTVRATDTPKIPQKIVVVDDEPIEGHSNLDESKKPYIAIARAYGRSHPICRFCHREYPSLADGACASCFEKSFRYRETPRRLQRCLSCKELAQVFEAKYYFICENCYNDRKGAFCAHRVGNAQSNDGGYPFAGCRGCGKDHLVNGFGYCEECYGGVHAVHPVRLCTRCGQYGLNNHLSRESIFAADHAGEEVWKKDMELAMSTDGGSWGQRYQIAADICQACWKAASRARKQKSSLNSVMQGLKKRPSTENSANGD